MVDVSMPGYQIFWTNGIYTLKSEYQTLVQQYPEADAQQKTPHNLLGDIEDVTRE
jgi:hypothetical protein